MKYQLTIKKGAVKSLANIPLADQKRIDAAILKLQDSLSGDVKKLKEFSPRYRLRVGNYRVLFEVEGNEVIIHLIEHRREAYR